MMSAFESAWSFVKSNPNRQAFNELQDEVHPDARFDQGYSNTINLGTIDPQAYIYSRLARAKAGAQKRVHGPRGLRDAMQTARKDLRGPAWGGYAGVEDFRAKPSIKFGGDGFHSQNAERVGSVGRMARPHAVRLPAPEGTPQALLEALEHDEEQDRAY